MDLAKVMELSSDGQSLLVRAGVGWKKDIIGKATVAATEDTSEGRTLASEEPLISPDIDQESRFTYAKFLTDNGVRAVASVIIKSHIKPPYGILQVDSRIPRQFTDDDTDFLRSYANLLACAVDRHKAEAAMRRSNAALEARVNERTLDLTEANGRLEAEATERERVEDVLRQSQKMEAVGQLTGGLAHDFNNLLAAISGNLEMIEIRITQGRTAELGRYIKSAMTSVNRAAALTHRLLAFSRRQTLDPKPTDVNVLISGLHELFSRTVGPSISIETHLSDKIWEILCDSNQLENVLLNLVLNARDAMPQGGHLLIETANVVLADRLGAPYDKRRENMAPGEYIVLSIGDDGSGMSPEVLTRAFDPFFTTKPLGQGTGLGLSMAHGFVEQSGGHVYLASDGGRGCIVTICLPRYRELHDMGEVSGADKSRPVVLVVEDEPDVRIFIVDALLDLQYEVLEAANGASGLALLDGAKRVDLLLTDVGLPGGMNGRQLADAARLRRPELNVLFITGYDESSAISTGLMERRMQVMTKPFHIAALVERVQGMVMTTV